MEVHEEIPSLHGAECQVQQLDRLKIAALRACCLLGSPPLLIMHWPKLITDVTILVPSTACILSPLETVLAAGLQDLARID